MTVIKLDERKLLKKINDIVVSDVRSQEGTRQFFVNNVVFTECLPKIRDQLSQVSVANCLLRHGATLSINETQLLTVYDNVTALIHLRSMGGPDIGSHLMYMAIRENTTEHNEAVRLLEETALRMEARPPANLFHIEDLLGDNNLQEKSIVQEESSPITRPEEEMPIEHPPVVPEVQPHSSHHQPTHNNSCIRQDQVPAESLVVPKMHKMTLQDNESIPNRFNKRNITSQELTPHHKQATLPIPEACTNETKVHLLETSPLYSGDSVMSSRLSSSSDYIQTDHQVKTQGVSSFVAPDLESRPLPLELVLPGNENLENESHREPDLSVP